MKQNAANWREKQKLQCWRQAENRLTTFNTVIYFSICVIEGHHLFSISCQSEKLMPVRFDEDVLRRAAAERYQVLSKKILGLCGELPIYWLQPISPKGCIFFLSQQITDPLYQKYPT